VTRITAWCAVLALTIAGVGCGGDDSDSSYVESIRAAVEAVETERGGPQEYFEVTANRQLTNVFVAVDGGSAAIPYVYLDGELQSPGPRLEGASGHTFVAADIEFDENLVFTQIEEQLPEATVGALSVEGAAGETVRYVVSTLSQQGGSLDVTVGPDGSVLAVDPI